MRRRGGLKAAVALGFRAAWREARETARVRVRGRGGVAVAYKGREEFGSGTAEVGDDGWTPLVCESGW
jgi:hypothetical protein